MKIKELITWLQLVDMESEVLVQEHTKMTRYPVSSIELSNKQAIIHWEE